MSEKKTMSDFSHLNEEPELMEAISSSVTFFLFPESVEMTNVPAPGMTDQTVNDSDQLVDGDHLREDTDLSSHHSSSSEDDQSLCSLSLCSLSKYNRSICTSVWSSAASDVSEEIPSDIRSEERSSSCDTSINKIFNFMENDEEQLMNSDDLRENNHVAHHVSSINEEMSDSLTWASLSEDRSTFSVRPFSCSSSSSISSALSKVTQEAAGEIKDNNTPHKVQTVLHIHVTQRLSPRSSEEEERGSFCREEAEDEQIFNITEKDEEQLMNCDNLRENNHVTHHVSSINEEMSDSMTCCSLSEERSTFSVRPFSCSSSSSVSSALSKVTQEAAGEIKDNNTPHKIQTLLHIHVAQRLSPRSSEEEESGSFSQEEPEDEEAESSSFKASACSHSENSLDTNKEEETQAGCKNTMNKKKRSLRWWRSAKVAPTPLKLSDDEAAKSDCKAEGEGTRRWTTPEWSSSMIQPKQKNKSSFTKFFSNIFSKNEKKMKEKEEERTSSYAHAERSPFWVQIICGSQARKSRITTVLA